MGHFFSRCGEHIIFLLFIITLTKERNVDYMEEIIERPVASGIEANKDQEETIVDNIDYDGFEFVRREFFSHTFEVSVIELTP